MNKEEEKIEGGAVLWARKTIESEIFYWKPDKWFKIWFYIVHRANFKDNKLFKRGENFFTYKEIQDNTKATRNQVDHCIRWLKQATMIATRKTTRGLIITITRYGFYQTLGNYYIDKSDTESEVKAIQKRYRSDTISKNVKKEKNEINIIYTSYKALISGTARLTGLAEKKIDSRLREYSEDELLRAIKNFSNKPWWMEKNAERGIAWFFHSEDRVDQFLNLKNDNEVEKAWKAVK